MLVVVIIAVVVVKRRKARGKTKQEKPNANSNANTNNVFEKHQDIVVYENTEACKEGIYQENIEAYKERIYQDLHLHETVKNKNGVDQQKIYDEIGVWDRRWYFQKQMLLLLTLQLCEKDF